LALVSDVTMAKRVADTQLTDRNCGDDDGATEEVRMKIKRHYGMLKLRMYSGG